MAKKVKEEVSPKVQSAAEKADLIGINERAILVYCGISQWAGVKKDKEQTKKVTDELGAVEGAYRVNKSLLPGAQSLEDLRKLLSEWRTYHYNSTTTYGRDGWALLSSKKIGSYKQKFVETFDRYEVLLRRFVEEYPDLVEKARLRGTGLGTGFNELDYPTASEVRRRFALTTDMRRIRESQSSLLGVSDEIVKEISDEADKRIREGLAVSISSLVDRLTKAVANVAAVCGKEGEKAPKIYDSLIGNVREIAEALPELDVAGVGDLQRIANKMLDKLGAIDAETLKGTDPDAVDARKEVKETAEEILADLSGAF